MHAQLNLHPDFDIAAHRVRPKIAVKFGPELVLENQKKFIYRIRSIETEMVKDFKESIRPAIGDELLAINGIALSQWSEENFIFCKFPLRTQCAINIFDHFRKGFLSWDWRASLKYTIKRNGRVWTIDVPFEIPSKAISANQVIEINKKNSCHLESSTYDDFEMMYQGLNICVFESKKYPQVTLLKIGSFRYRDLPRNILIQSLQDEVDQFNSHYWQAKSSTTKKLIIDLIDNGGGDVPVPWYKIFYDSPFQEQYVEFKKLAELDIDEIRKELFYENQGKEIWFQDLKSRGIYQKILLGNFLPAIPQFCALELKNCKQGLFHPQSHGFKGQVRILSNEWCISTCSGFVWSMKQELKGRVKIIGIPDSGDSSYARLYLDVYLDPNHSEGFRLAVTSRVGGQQQQLPEGALLRQQVSATRSTDAHGKIISGNPSPVDVWVPYEYYSFDDSWESKTFKAALLY